MPLTPARLALLLVLAAPPAFAAEKPPAPAAAEIDLSALRYYASRNETRRVEAEIRRLRSLYPGWQPPADPAAIAVESDPSPDQPLWDLFKADRLDELKDEIAKRRAADASFEPPAELEAKLAAKEARALLVQASDKGDFAAVATMARTPGLVTPADLDVSWRAAEAAARLGDTARSVEINRAILAEVQNPNQRLATV